MRKIIALLTLAATLALPAGTFAATQTGNTTESGILGPTATISLTIPATATYANAAPNWATVETLSNITTNNVTGLTITATVDVYTASSGPSAPTTVRHTYCDNPTGGTGTLTKCADIPAGAWLTSATVKTIASSTGAVSGVSMGVNQEAAQSAFTTPGATYTSAVHWSAATN